MDETLDYATIYKTLSAGVKKGFFKKTSPNDSGGDFACVSKNLGGQECPELAGLFLLGKAKCEAGSRNPLSEASTLFTAAEYFVQAEDKLCCVNAVNYGEYLDCATMCLLRSAKMYEVGELFTLAGNVYIYIVDILMRHNKFGETIPYLRRAIQILSKDILCSLQLLHKLVCCQLRIHDWPGALNTCLQIQAMIYDPGRRLSLVTDPPNPDFHIDNGKNSMVFYSNYWVKAEVIRVFLVLLTAPSQKLSDKPDGGYSLDRYSFSTDIPADEYCWPLNPDLFMHLQSFILAFRAKHVVEVEAISSVLQSFLDVDQRELMVVLINDLTNPPGSGL
ncbi:unnamed protein product [Calicophoron daubneyi]|uniref:Factor VIII intron 22 protein n=1 Tax=Calicophoron daubneyi TaxID=300641 RepID=A0AAV2SZV7_CALDB